MRVYVLMYETDIEGVFESEQDAWDYALKYLAESEDEMDMMYVEETTLRR